MIINNMQYFLGTSELRSNIIFWAIIVYLIIFLIIIPIHRNLRKKRLIKEQEIVKDVDEMIEHAFKEGNPLYPVPKEFSRKDFENIYRLVLK